MLAGLAGRIVSPQGEAGKATDLSNPANGFEALLGQFLGRPGETTTPSVSGLGTDLLSLLTGEGGTGLADLEALVARLEALFDGEGNPDGDMTDPLAGLMDLLSGLLDPARPLLAGLEVASDGSDTGAPRPDAATLAAGLRGLADRLAEVAPELAGRLGGLAGRLEAEPVDEALLRRLGLATPAAAPSPAGTATDAPAGVEALLQRPEDRGFRRPDSPTPSAPQALGDGGAGAAGEARPDAPARAVERPLAGAERDTRPPAAAAAGTQIAATSDAAADAGHPDLLAPLPVGGQPRVEGSALPRLGLAPYPQSLAQAAVPQLAFEIARQVAAGQSRFQIRLDPPELGRIDVRLDIDGAGGVNARLAVDRAETLDLLQRDHRALERALAQAGLDTDRTSLEFTLRQGHSGGRDDGAPQRERRGGDPLAGLPAESEPSLPAITLYRGTASPGGIDRLA